MAGTQIHVATVEEHAGLTFTPELPAFSNITLLARSAQSCPHPFPAFWESFANPDSHAWATLAAFSGAISAVAGLPLPHLHL